MKQFTFDSCLLYVNNEDNKNNDFDVVELQIDDILILADEKFATVEKNELRAIKLLIKNREKLTKITSIKFNEDYIKKTNNNLYFNQSRQCNCFRLVIIKLINLINTRNVVKSNVIFKNQYVIQRIRRIYIVIMIQS